MKTIQQLQDKTSMDTCYSFNELESSFKILKWFVWDVCNFMRKACKELVYIYMSLQTGSTAAKSVRTHAMAPRGYSLDQVKIAHIVRSKTISSN